MILLDTSVLIDALTGPRRSAPALRRAVERGERLLVPSLVFYEWLRGPRLRQELADQEALLPLAAAAPFGPAEAVAAARLYQSVGRPRGREMDLAIAACALVRNAELWTLNPRDFRDLPGLRLAAPPGRACRIIEQRTSSCIRSSAMTCGRRRSTIIIVGGAATQLPTRVVKDGGRESAAKRVSGNL